MAPYASIYVTIFAATITGCSNSTNTVVLDWTPDMSSSGDSVATAFSEVLGDGPDSLQRCSNRRVRLGFVDSPGDFPVRGEATDGTLIQSGPGWQIERNLVRSIAYASAQSLEKFGIDTLVITLTRSSRDAGSQRSSYEIVRSDVVRGNSDSAPVRPVSLVEQPCGTTRK